MQLSAVTLAVSDMTRARTYYQALFPGASPEERGGVCYFRLEGTELALFPRDALARYFGVQAAGSGFGGVTLSINLDSQQAVDATCARMRDAGATVSVAPGPASWGGHVGCIRDADGHLVELVWNPGRG